jgi:hypothetical protein
VHAADIQQGALPPLGPPATMSAETHALLEAYDAFFTDDLDFMRGDGEDIEQDPRITSRNFIPVLIMLHLDWKSHHRISGQA